ncbi:hypothetical protein LT330_010777 [Penicillium expansum]|nr:hypothetical protein LT330_010777 [Penicillium expansum]
MYLTCIITSIPSSHQANSTSFRTAMASPRFGRSPERIDEAFSTPVVSRAQSPANAHPSLIPSSTQAHHRHSTSRTSIISVSSTGSSDIEVLPTSQPAAGDILWVGRARDGSEISLINCLRTGFPHALINPTLRSTRFGTEEICLHCILCVAFDDIRALVHERPFCMPGPGTTCQRCAAGNLACFRAPLETARRLSLSLLRDGLRSRPTISYTQWQDTCLIIARSAGVDEVALRRQMNWDNRMLGPRERHIVIRLD